MLCLAQHCWESPKSSPNTCVRAPARTLPSGHQVGRPVGQSLRGCWFLGFRSPVPCLALQGSKDRSWSLGSRNCKFGLATWGVVHFFLLSLWMASSVKVANLSLAAVWWDSSIPRRKWSYFLCFHHIPTSLRRACWEVEFHWQGQGRCNVRCFAFVILSGFMNHYRMTHVATYFPCLSQDPFHALYAKN